MAEVRVHSVQRRRERSRGLRLRTCDGHFASHPLIPAVYSPADKPRGSQGRGALGGLVVFAADGVFGEEFGGGAASFAADAD